MAQSELFKGGFGSGYAMDKIMETNLSISLGSFGHGYSQDNLIDVNKSKTMGGHGSGHDSDTTIHLQNSLTKGGQGDAHDLELYLNTVKSMTLGGHGHGYDMADFLRICWIGVASWKWENPANWSSNQVPDFRHHVIIKNNVPNYPIITNTELYLGRAGQEPGHHCKSLDILSGASLRVEQE